MDFHGPVIFVRNISVSRSFYTGILGMEIEHDFGKNLMYKEGFTIWEIRKDHEISNKLKTRRTENNFELYFETPDLEILLRDLKNEGVNFLHELITEPWGQRTLRFFDPDNHLIEVGEPLEVFIQRFAEEGLNPNQIAERTGVPPETVKRVISK